MKEFYEFYLINNETTSYDLGKKFKWYFEAAFGLDSGSDSENESDDEVVIPKVKSSSYDNSDLFSKQESDYFVSTIDAIPNERESFNSNREGFGSVDSLNDQNSLFDEEPLVKPAHSFLRRNKIETTFEPLKSRGSSFLNANKDETMYNEKLFQDNVFILEPQQVSNSHDFSVNLTTNSTPTSLSMETRDDTFILDAPIVQNKTTRPAVTKPAFEKQDIVTIHRVIVHIDISSSKKFYKGAELRFEKAFQELEKKGIITLAIKNRLKQRGIIKMNTNTTKKNKYPLEIKIIDVDSFGEFIFDFFQDICRIYLKQENNQDFPQVWQLSESAVIELFPKFKYYTEVENQDKTKENKFQYKEQKSTSDADDNDLNSLIASICRKEGKDKAGKWMDILTSLDVDTVDDLKKWSVHDWEQQGTSLKPNLKIAIQKELEDRKKESSSNKKEKKDNVIKESELIGKLHNIKRYFYYHADKIKDIPLLDREAIELGFTCLDYQGEMLLSDIKSRFFKIFEFSNIAGVKTPKGLLLYGPPGTGKTKISGSLPALIGLTEVVEAIASTEVNRSLVGETEKILLDLCSRAHRIPHLAACIAIDEIDNLAPKRSDDTSQGKKDALSMLLAVLGGIKNVPNLVFLASTNLRNDIDEAFLRRMRGQFFVGRPNPESRGGFFQKLSQFFPIDNETLAYLISITCNFTGAALEELNSDIIVKMLSLGKTVGSSLDRNLAVKCAADICDQFPSLLIGKYNLPELFTRQKVPTPISLPKADYTGRIVVDLSGSSCVLRYSKQKKENNIVIPLFFEAFPDSKIDTIVLPQSLISSSTILPYFANFAKKLNIDIIQLIDLNVLMRNNAFDDKEIKEVLNERMDEVGNYKKTLVIFDLDSLVGVSMNQSDSSMGVSKSTSIHNVGTFITIIHYFLECYFDKDDTSKMRWTCVVSSNAYLLEAFKEATKFEKALMEKDYEEKMSQENAPRTCLSCKTKYIQAENEKNPAGCEFHPGFLYDVKNMNTKVMEDEVQDYITKHPEHSLLHICCGQAMSSKGCECNYHDSEQCFKKMKARKYNTVYHHRWNNYYSHSLGEFERNFTSGRGSSSSPSAGSSFKL